MLTGGIDDFDQVLNVNLRGAWLLIRAGAKAMIDSTNPGAMVTVSSINALRPGTVDYSTSKAGVEGLTRAAANMLGEHHIRVNAVRSGFIDTAMLRYAWDVPPDVPFPIGPEHATNVPLGRVGQPAETAAAIVWLCSSSASYVTATCLDVDGGALGLLAGREELHLPGERALRPARSVWKEVPVTSPVDQPDARARRGGLIPLGEATRAWFAISLQTFGGPAGQIAVMQHALVDEKRWIGQKRFLHALSFCTLLPGPEAQQLAIYIGWLLNGVVGGLIAGVLFVLPGVLALLVLSALYVAAGDTTIVTAVLAAVAPAVLVIVAQAVVRVGGRALGHPALVALAVAAFIALSIFKTPFPLVDRRRRSGRVGTGPLGAPHHA